MANIFGDYDYFKESISAVESYISAHKGRMGTIDRCITNLNASWQGVDYDQLKQEWEEMNNTDSTSEQMLMALEAYADKLSYAAQMYEATQSNALDRANSLRRY